MKRAKTIRLNFFGIATLTMIITLILDYMLICNVHSYDIIDISFINFFATPVFMYLLDKIRIKKEIKSNQSTKHN